MCLFEAVVGLRFDSFAQALRDGCRDRRSRHGRGSAAIAVGLRDIHLVKGLQPGYSDRLTSARSRRPITTPPPWREPVWPLWDVAITK